MNVLTKENVKKGENKKDYGQVWRTKVFSYSLKDMRHVFNEREYKITFI